MISEGLILGQELDRSSAPDEGCQVTLKIGRFAVSLRSAEPSFRRMLKDRYRGFLEPDTKPRFRFEVTLLEPGTRGSDEGVRVSRDGDRWHASRGDFSASWDATTGQGSVQLSANPYAADTLLRIVNSIALAESGGFLLHAASAVRAGRAFIFSGVSGAGKTTVARLAPSDTRVLTDEMSYIVKEANGYRAWGTPFAGELARIGENISAPIAGLFFLEKSGRNRLSDIEPGVAVRRLLRNILFLASEEDLVARLFHAAAEFVSRVPVRRMEFTPDSHAWELIG